jgi:hypothetical protein
MQYALARRKLDLAEQLSINAMAAQGSGKVIDEQVKKLSK